MNEGKNKPDLVDNDETLWIGAAVAAVIFALALVIEVNPGVAILLGLILFGVLAFILHIKLGFGLPNLGTRYTPSGSPETEVPRPPVPRPPHGTEPEPTVPEPSLPKAEPPVAQPPAAETPKPVPAAAAPAAAAAPIPAAENRPLVQPSTPLPGEADLAGRKGQWRYEPDAAPAAGASEADRPQGLMAPRGDAPDDLKRIKGIGPALEEMLHGLGYYHFDQIAAWTLAEVAWVDDNLEGFKGRVSRDEWVAQARELASGD
ncbi:endonuclease [Halovulum sp. GXIMD14794]